MESMLFDKKERILNILYQIENSIELLQKWNQDLQRADDYLFSPEGEKNLAASCMLIESIGEAYKKIDKDTKGLLLPLYSDIPWQAVKGIRDRIAHGYFEIDADIIFETVKENLPPLLDATRFFIKKIAE